MTQTIHVDSNVLLDNNTLKNVLNKTYVKKGQFRVVASPFALSEVYAKTLSCNLPQGVELYWFTEDSWKEFTSIVNDLLSEIKWLGLYDILIVATALADAHAKFLLTIDKQIINSRAIRDRAMKKGLRITDPYSI
ncbi:MAG: hypothetical protein QXP31_06535 [Pyrobaculum sp.]